MFAAYSSTRFLACVTGFDGGGGMKRMSVFLDAESHADIAAIRRANGPSSDSAAVRFALRRLARDIEAVDSKR
jgi:hypothetical protein